MARNPDGKVLAKINDISDFMVKTTDDLEHMNSMESLEQSQCQVSQGLQIVGLNADRIFSIINKFKMIPIQSQ